MPLVRTPNLARFSGRGPVPRPVSMGRGLAVMLLCLQDGQTLVAPEGDDAETVFTVLEGEGEVVDGEATHAVVRGDAVHVMPGRGKSLRAGAGRFVVLGVRRLAREREGAA